MSDRNEALQLAGELHRVSTICDHHYSLDRAAASELERLVTERKVFVDWIKAAIFALEIEGIVHNDKSPHPLIESGRRLVDGGPDDLLKGVG